ncbi:MAG: hypothetical protein QGG50_02575 [Methanopyri archaeon]|jgi:hypothetical protein|nr:hypothetical protein [Methanopyri archaeon]
MDVILDYTICTYKSIDTEFGANEGCTVFEPRTDEHVAYDVAMLVEQYDALLDVSVCGGHQDLVRHRDGITTEREVYRITLSADEVTVHDFLESVRDLGYGTPESYSAASVSLEGADEVRGSLVEFVRELEPERSFEQYRRMDTPRGTMPATVVRWD